VEVERPTTPAKRRGTRMPDLDPRSCPCGDEPLAGGGLHLLGVECCSRVTLCVGKYFGHRGHSGEFEDAVQECYLHLAKPSTFETFRPPAEAPADAFRGWLYTVVDRKCRDLLRREKRRSDLWKLARMRMAELKAPATPLEAAARRCILERSQYSIDVVRKARWAHGADCGRRFEILLDAVLKDRLDYPLLGEQLGIPKDAVRTARYELEEALARAFRERTRDELCLEPGLSPERIEDLIDADIEDLFTTAFPHETVPWQGLDAHLEATQEKFDQ